VADARIANIPADYFTPPRTRAGRRRTVRRRAVAAVIAALSIGAGLWGAAGGGSPDGPEPTPSVSPRSPESTPSTMDDQIHHPIIRVVRRRMVARTGPTPARLSRISDA
jgi:hypothetical protein